MASPDVRRYVNLTLFDKDALAIFQLAVGALQARYPDWQPAETSTEVMLLQALAIEASEVVFAVNRTPAMMTEVLLRLFGLTPDLGLPATATATFTVADDAGHIIPPGTRVRLNFGGDSPPCDFLTDDNLEILVGDTEGTVGVTATETGIRAHSAPAGTALSMVDAIFFVDAVELATQPSGGTKGESSQEFLDRGVNRLARLVTTLVHPEHFTAAALDDTRVARATTINNYDPAVGPDPGDNPGHVTVIVAGEDGALLSGGIKSEIDDALSELAQANLAVHVDDPDINEVDADVTVVKVPGYDDAEVDAAVVAAITDYFDPNNWDWGGTVYESEVEYVARQVPSVLRVTSVTITGGSPNLVLTGVAPLVTAGTIDVTVT